MATTVAEILTSVSTAVSIAKTVSDINKGFEEAEYKLQMAQLMTSLADAQMKLSSLQLEIAEKEAEIERLKGFDLTLAGMAKKGGYWYLLSSAGEPEGMPYCPHCIDEKRGVFELHRAEKSGRAKFCTHCRNTYPEAPRIAPAIPAQ